MIVRSFASTSNSRGQTREATRQQDACRSPSDPIAIHSGISSLEKTRMFGFANQRGDVLKLSISVKRVNVSASIGETITNGIAGMPRMSKNSLRTARPSSVSHRPRDQASSPGLIQINWAITESIVWVLLMNGIDSGIARTNQRCSATIFYVLRPTTVFPGIVSARRTIAVRTERMTNHGVLVYAPLISAIHRKISSASMERVSNTVDVTRRANVRLVKTSTTAITSPFN